METLISQRLTNRFAAFVVLWLLAAMVLAVVMPLPVHAQLRGHGGPVRALAVSPDGATALSGSFDTSAIRWSLKSNSADQVLRFHESAVNAVAIAPDGRLITGGEDGRVAVWKAGEAKPSTVFEGHTAPVVSLAVSPDGSTIASASWDRTVRLWPIGGGTARVLEGHNQNVNGVAFMPDGKSLVSASYDLTVRVWPLDGSAPNITTLPSPLNAVAVARDGEIAAGSADGRVFFLAPNGDLRGETAAGETPIIAIAVANDGALVAAAGIRGSVALIERTTRQLAAHAGWTRPAGVVGGFPARQPDARHRRHRPDGAALGRDDRRPHRLGAGERC